MLLLLLLLLLEPKSRWQAQGQGCGRLWHACSVACHKRDLNESQRRQLSHDSEFQRNRQLLRIVAVAVAAIALPVAAAVVAARHSTHARDTFGTLAAIKCTRMQLQSLPLSAFLSLCIYDGAHQQLLLLWHLFKRLWLPLIAKYKREKRPHTQFPHLPPD